MRAIRVGLIGLLLVLGVLSGCVPPTATAAPSPSRTASTVSTSSTQQPTLPPTTATAATAPASTTPTAPLTSGPAIEGPLMALGLPIKSLVLAGQAPVRYALLAEGLARSDDGGLTWRRVTTLVLPQPLVSPQSPRTLYAGAVAQCYKGGPDPAFQRSSDGGESWQELEGGRGIKPVAEHPSRPGTLYGISCAGFHVSRDGGQTWQATGPTQGLDITSILPLAGGQVRFLAALTSEGGSSHLAWLDEAGKLAQDMPEGLNFWGPGALAQAGPSLYVAVSTGVWRSDDGAAHWAHFNDGLADVTLAQDPLVAGLSEADAQRGYGLFSLAADPTRPERLALGTVRGIYLSQDRGEHWQPLGVELPGQGKVTAIVWDATAPGVLYATTAKGVYTIRLGK